MYNLNRKISSTKIPSKLVVVVVYNLVQRKINKISLTMHFLIHLVLFSHVIRPVVELERLPVVIQKINP